MAVVADDRPMTELLRQAATYQAIDFQLDYGKGAVVAPPLVEPLVYFAHRLSAEATCDLYQGDAASAVTNISVILALVNNLEDERLLIFQQIRIYMTWIVANTTWGLLQSSNLNDAQLVLLQSRWNQLEFIRATENAYLVERARSESEIVKMQASDKYFNDAVSWAKPADVNWSDGLRDGLDSLTDWAKFTCAESMFRSSWIYSDELRMLENDQDILETIRTAETNRFFNPAYRDLSNKLRDRAVGPNDWITKLDDFGFHIMFGIVNSERNPLSLTMGSEAMRRMVVTAIALKRYQLKHGNYPQALSDLMPKFLSDVPQDPVDGKPLRYRLTADGDFLLYSIGENGKDDRGDGSSRRKGAYREYYWADPDLLDWVWPQPATAAEIQYFYAHPPGP
jgi:hypothetical protein